MNKRLVLLLVALALSMSFAAPTMVLGEEFKFACADIDGGGGGTTDPESDGTWNVSVGLQTSGRCGGMLYTLHVFAEACGVGVPSTFTSRGTDGTGGVAIFGTNVDDDSVVYVYVTSSQGKTVYDTAPDTDCVELSTFPPAGGFH
jgi:hypothetical protein